MENVLFNKIVVKAEDTEDLRCEQWTVTEEVNGFAVWRGNVISPEMMDWFPRSSTARDRSLELAVTQAAAELAERRCEAPLNAAEKEDRKKETVTLLGEIRREMAAARTVQ